MRGRGLVLAFLFVVAVVALAWLTGDDGPWGADASADPDSSAEVAP